MANRLRNFLVIIADRDTKQFNVVGPMDDDTPWNTAVGEAQRAGRNVMCQTASENDRDAVIATYSRQMGLTFTENLLVEKPVLRDVYHGALPAYAQHADRERVVRILCKGRCNGKMSWAEMDRPFPGTAVLRKAELGQYTATCLQCGDEALDCYNWTR